MPRENDSKRRASLISHNAKSRGGGSDAEKPWDAHATFRATTEPLIEDEGQRFRNLMRFLEAERISKAGKDVHSRLAQAVVQKNKMFMLLSDTSSDAYFVKDLSLKYVYVNPAMERLLSLPRNRIIGRRDEDLFSRDDADMLADACSQVLEGWTVRKKHSRRIGSAERTFLDTLVPWRDETGKVRGVYGVSVDITDREEEILPSELKDADYRSPEMRDTLSQALLVARTGSTVLLTGETGSGKDYLARYIHDHSERAAGPFMSINCAAIPADLIESELFGYEKGAFSGADRLKKGLIEAADGGTLLLNEIGELSMPLQSKLLTFLDTYSFIRIGGRKGIKVDARIIAATNVDLEAAIEERRFREDLFFRLNVFSLRVPPLRERIEDLPKLLRDLLPMLAGKVGLSSYALPDSAAMELLENYHWPGNVRELRNVLERALILTGGKRITAGALELKGSKAPRPRNEPVRRETAPPSPSESEASEHPSRSMLQDPELPPPRIRPQKPSREVLKSLFRDFIEKRNWTRARLAQHLGVDSSTLKKWLKEAGLPAGKSGRPPAKGPE